MRRLLLLHASILLWGLTVPVQAVQVDTGWIK